MKLQHFLEYTIDPWLDKPSDWAEDGNIVLYFQYKLNGWKVWQHIQADINRA